MSLETRELLSCPDGLWFDDGGILWIQTDVSACTLNRGHYERLGNNMTGKTPF